VLSQVRPLSSLGPKPSGTFQLIVLPVMTSEEIIVRLLNPGGVVQSELVLITLLTVRSAASTNAVCVGH
jgi:hypothetical protein